MKVKKYKDCQTCEDCLRRKKVGEFFGIYASEYKTIESWDGSLILVHTGITCYNPILIEELAEKEFKETYEDNCEKTFDVGVEVGVAIIASVWFKLIEVHQVEHNE